MKSYDARQEHRDFESEVVRLRAQAGLTWAQEFRAMTMFGLRDGMSIVDLGSGPGFTVKQLLGALPRCRVTAVEIDSAMAARAERELASARRRMRMVIRSAGDTGLPSGRFDFVIARYLFQHLEDPVAGAREAFRILKPGGSLIVVDVDQGIWGLSDPPIPKLQRVMQRYAAAHAARGRDRRVGRKLWRILAAGGFGEIEGVGVVAHSDALGLRAFAAQLDLARVTPLVRRGLVPHQELVEARQARDAFLRSPRSLLLAVALLVCGRKPGAAHTA